MPDFVRWLIRMFGASRRRHESAKEGVALGVEAASSQSRHRAEHEAGTKVELLLPALPSPRDTRLRKSRIHSTCFKNGAVAPTHRGQPQPRIVMKKNLSVSLLMVVAIVSARAIAASPTPSSPPSRGESALKASFYLNTVPTLVEMVSDTKKDILDALELDAKKRATVEKTLGELWTEKRLYANATAIIEKQLAPEVLDAAIRQMTPEVQAMVLAGISEATPEQAKTWLAAAQKLPDAKEREALARRIAAHMPQPEPFKELLSQVGEVLADVSQVASGSDELRQQLGASLMEGLAPAIQAMGQKEAMVASTLIAYRDQSTANLRLLADALDSEAGRKLQAAALSSLLGGVKQTRQELVAQLERELKPKKKK